MADIVLVNLGSRRLPGASNTRYRCSARIQLLTACLPLLAALTPAGHSVTIVDEDVEPIDFDLLRGPTSWGSPA